MSQDDSDELLTVLAWCAGGLALLCCCCYLSCCRFRKVDSAIKDVPVVCGGPKSDSTTSGHTGGGSRSVKIITYNTWCLPSALCCRDPAGRASMICERLLQGDYDVICLQELFDGAARDIMVEGLQQGGTGGGYNVIVDVGAARGRLGTSCGLVLASRLPIVWAGFSEYEGLVGPDSWATKGVLLAKLDLQLDGGGPAAAADSASSSASRSPRHLMIAVSHCQADPDCAPCWWPTCWGSSWGRARAARLLNFEQVNNAIEANACDVAATLVCGDLNTPGDEDEYPDMMKALGDPLDLYRNQHPMTNGSDDVGGGGDSSSSDADQGFTYMVDPYKLRLDYMLLTTPKQPSPGAASEATSSGPTVSVSSVLVNRMVQGGVANTEDPNERSPLSGSVLRTLKSGDSGAVGGSSPGLERTYSGLSDIDLLDRTASSSSSAALEPVLPGGQGPGPKLLSDHFALQAVLDISL